SGVLVHYRVHLSVKLRVERSWGNVVYPYSIASKLYCKEAHKIVKTGFCGIIRRIWMGQGIADTLTAYGGYVYDAAALAVLDHGLCKDIGHISHAVKISVYDLIPLFEVFILKEVGRAGNSGAVDQNVYVVEFRKHGVLGSLDAVEVRHVAGDGDALCAVDAQFIRCLLSLFYIPAENGHVGPCLGVSGANTEAYSAVASGDDNIISFDGKGVFHAFDRRCNERHLLFLHFLYSYGIVVCHVVCA